MQLKITGYCTGTVEKVSQKGKQYFLTGFFDTQSGQVAQVFGDLKMSPSEKPQVFIIELNNLSPLSGTHVNVQDLPNKK